MNRKDIIHWLIETQTSLILTTRLILSAETRHPDSEEKINELLRNNLPTYFNDIKFCVEHLTECLKEELE